LAAFVVDTSALICVLNEEEEAGAFKLALKAADSVQISIGTAFEASCVVRDPRFPDGTSRLNALLHILDMDYAPFDDEQMHVARMAYARYGRGSGHRARLNMGNCFSYALAKSRNLPLLFKGDDFIHTDIEPALKPG
jgi:ribonuclease VapC